MQIITEFLRANAISVLFAVLALLAAFMLGAVLASRATRTRVFIGRSCDADGNYIEMFRVRARTYEQARYAAHSFGWNDFEIVELARHERETGRV